MSEDSLTSANKRLSAYQGLFFSMYGVASVIVTATVLPILGFLAVCLRFYVRIRLTPTYVGIDDWLIAFSCFLVLGQGAMQVVGMILKQLSLSNQFLVSTYTRLVLKIISRIAQELL